MLSALCAPNGVRRLPEQLIDGPTLDLLDEGLRLLTAFSGTESENMTRNFAWRFLDMGRRIERACHAVDLMRGLLIEREDLVASGTLPLLLELADSSMTYRSRYLMTPLLAPVLDLLLLDETNPRAVAFQLAVIETHLQRLPDSRARKPALQPGATHRHAAPDRAAPGRPGRPGRRRARRAAADPDRAARSPRARPARAVGRDLPQPLRPCRGALHLDRLGPNRALTIEP